MSQILTFLGGNNMRRESEVIIVKDCRKELSGVFEAKRIPVELPWDAIVAMSGYCAKNILVDITGAVEELERFKQALVDVKDCTDAIDNECLNKRM